MVGKPGGQLVLHPVERSATRQKKPNQCMILSESVMLQAVVTKRTIPHCLSQHENCCGAMKTHKAIPLPNLSIRTLKRSH